MHGERQPHPTLTLSFFFPKSAVLDLTFCWQQATIHKPKMVLKLVICTTQFFKLTKGRMRPYHADFSWKTSVAFHWIGQNSGVSFTLNALSSFLKMFWKTATSQKAQAPTLVNWRSSKTSVLNDFFFWLGSHWSQQYTKNKSMKCPFSTNSYLVEGQAF